MALSYVGLRFRKTLNGAGGAMTQIPLVEGTYYDGNVLRLSGTSGSGTKVAADGTTVAYVLSGNVTKANSVSGKYSAYILDNNNVFEARMLATGAPQARVGDLANIAVGSTYNYRLQGTTTSGPLRIVGYHPDESTSGHANGRFYVTGARTQFGAFAKLSSE